MTTPSTVRKAGPFTGNGTQTAWPFTFKVFTADDIVVVATDANGDEATLVLGADYTVALNPNQETSPGGTVTYLLPAGRKLAVAGAVTYDQPLDLPTGGSYSPIALENQLDRFAMQTQQLAEQLGRAVKVPVTGDGTGELSDALVHGILALEPVADDISTVADSIDDVGAVAANIGDVTTVATNIADITNFADVYLGGRVSDPTLRNDGTALQLGDLYFNIASVRMRVFGNGGWGDVGVEIPLTITPQAFSGNGSATVFTLPEAPAFPAALDVYISGVYQALAADYTVSGTTLTFLAAPPAGTNNIRVKILSAYAGGVPNDGSVTTAKLADGSVTTAKLADGAVTADKFHPSAVTPFAKTLLNDTTAAEAQQTLGSSVVGRQVWAAPDAEQARTALGVLATADTVNVYDAQYVFGDKMFMGGLRSGSPTVPLGYMAGAGGFVIQTTSKTTAVTINTCCGVITTHAASLAAGASVTFLVNNSRLSDLPAGAVVVANPRNTISTTYTVAVVATVSGAFHLRLTNISAGALAEAVPISFVIIQGSTV